MDIVFNELSPRVSKLRSESINSKVKIDGERAKIVTTFYKVNEGKYSTPVMRGMVFKEICLKKSIFIGAEELMLPASDFGEILANIFPELISKYLPFLLPLK